MYQFKNTNPMSQMIRRGNAEVAPSIYFNPTQREVNQMKTSSQVQNYASVKMMSEQGRTDMRGNVVGYSETMA